MLRLPCILPGSEVPAEMNDLVTRLIEFLEREKVVKRQLGPNVAPPADVSQQIETIFVGGMFFLEKFSYLIEKAVVDGSLENGKLFVNFQSFANMKSRGERYRAIDRLANEGFVYGFDEPGEWPYEHLKPVKFAHGDNLARAWFVIYENAKTSYALVAMGEAVAGVGDRRHIQYRGFWTTRASVTRSIAEYLSRVVNVQYL
jgi:hypothetical protein